MDPYQSMNKWIFNPLKYLSTYMQLKTYLELITGVKFSLYMMVLILLLMNMRWMPMLIKRFLTVRENNLCVCVWRENSWFWLVKVLINLLAGMKLTVPRVRRRHNSKVYAGIEEYHCCWLIVLRLKTVSFLSFVGRWRGNPSLWRLCYGEQLPPSPPKQVLLLTNIMSRWSAK